MSVAVGDSVLVPEYGGAKLTFDEKVVHLIVISAQAASPHAAISWRRGAVSHISCVEQYCELKHSVWLYICRHGLLYLYFFS